MCILFLVVGDESCPTVVCNNRDEYLSRATSRGALGTSASCSGRSISDLCNTTGDSEEVLVAYSPSDQHCGGSWLGFDKLNALSGAHPRIAIVLNFHMFRENPSLAKNQYDPQLLSRGHLVKDFLDDSTLSAMSYATKVFASREQYRTFNLVVVDESGDAWYISSSEQQSRPISLPKGQVIGLSNGYLRDSWEKVDRGTARLQQWLSSHRTDPTPVAGAVTAIHSLHNLLFHEQVYSMAVELVVLLQDNTPLADPHFGAATLAVQQLSAICVPPTLILPSITDDEPLHDRSHESTQSAARRAISRFQLLSSAVCEDKHLQQRVFATRTHTVLIHWAGHGSALPYDQEMHSSINSEQGVFLIVESDLSIDWKTLAMHEDVHVFHNIATAQTQQRQ